MWLSERLTKKKLISLPPRHKKYIQVTEAMNAPETRERELSPLQKIPDNYEKLVVCMDTGLQQEQDGIRIVNAIDFLLE